MFKNIAKAVALSVFGATLAACGGQAKAQSQLPAPTLASIVRIGHGYTFNLRTVQYVSIKRGDQYIIDRLGRKTPMTLNTLEQVTKAPDFVNFMPVVKGGELLANLAEAHRTYCDKGVTVIEWIYQPTERRDEGCAMSYETDLAARRN